MQPRNPKDIPDVTSEYQILQKLNARQAAQDKHLQSMGILKPLSISKPTLDEQESSKLLILDQVDDKDFVDLRRDLQTRRYS